MRKKDSEDYRPKLFGMKSELFETKKAELINLHYLVEALEFHSHCFRVAIDKSEYMTLLLNSSPSNPSPDRSDLPTMEEVLQQIIANPDFLLTRHPTGGLSGSKVRYYVDIFRQDITALGECYLRAHLKRDKGGCKMGG